MNALQHRAGTAFTWGAAVVASIALLAASLAHLVPLDPTEVLGFLTGGLAVWLTVREDIWNWPVGIANSAFYLIVFLQSRLCADMSLQAVYILLGFYGWYCWLHGGEGGNELAISRLTPRIALPLAATVVLGVWGMTVFLTGIGDAAPFWDALTTVLSLAAQYMLTRKLLENWWVWITADLIYIGLYASRHLVLTSLLYGIFLVMCLTGLRQWSSSAAPSKRGDSVIVTEGVPIG